jgi:IS30 family transposase
MTERIEHDAKGKRRTNLYYCHPYSAWERGSNEVHNRFVRRFIPKKTYLTQVTQKRVIEIQNFMNNYPRQILSWKTPNELFQEMCKFNNLSIPDQFSQLIY